MAFVLGSSVGSSQTFEARSENLTMVAGMGLIPFTSGALIELHSTCKALWQGFPGENWFMSKFKVLESQVAQNNRPIYPKVDHTCLKVAHNCKPLAFQVTDLLLLLFLSSLCLTPPLLSSLL